MSRSFQYQGKAESPLPRPDTVASAVGWLPSAPDQTRLGGRRIIPPAHFAPVPPISDHPEPSVDAALTYARNAEFPRPPKRVPQSHGVTCPDLTGDIPKYGWVRGQPPTPPRPVRRRLAAELPTVPYTLPVVPEVEWHVQQPGPVRPPRRLDLGGWVGPVNRALSRLFWCENVLPNLLRRRTTQPDSDLRPLLPPIPVWFAAENATPVRVRRLFQPAGTAPLSPDATPPPLWFPPNLMPGRKRVRSEPAERRFDATGPAVPSLVWFVQHHLPMMLRRRRPEWPWFVTDVGRSLMLPDDRPDPNARATNTQDVTVG